MKYGLWRADTGQWLVNGEGEALIFAYRQLAEPACKEWNERREKKVVIREIEEEEVAVYGIWIEHDETKDWISNRDGSMFHTLYRGIAAAQMEKENRSFVEMTQPEDKEVVLSIKIIGIDGLPVDI